MATMLEECITEYQLSVVRFCGQKNSMQWVIIKNFFLFTGGKCVSHKAVHNWVEKFSHERSAITIDGVTAALGCSHGLANSIMYDLLKLLKVCARWVPRELKA
jgi:hypothetical protein